MALDSGYSFIRLATWAIPMLGFLGTVLGITNAIAGVSPEQLEKDLSSVTGGLATAFDTTGLALLLTMVLMLISFILQRLEERTLQGVDDYVDRELFHRFARPGNEHGPMIEAMEHLVRRQAEVWATSLAEMDRHAHAVAIEQQDRLTSALAQAIEFSLVAHQQHLNTMRTTAQEQMTQTLRPLSILAASMKQQQIALKPVARAMQQMSETLGRLQDNEQHLLRLQKLLHQNLHVLSAAGSFEEAVQSLTAAIHLLSARGSMAGTLRLIGGENEKTAA
jgi:hypothetical protein